MMSLNIDPDNLHHAYLIESAVDDGLAAVRSFLQDELGMTLSGNPDVMKIREDRLGIATARKLRSAQQRKGLAQSKKIFIVGFSQATAEAQNALLKSLEEPTDDTHFFIVTPNTGTLLPTFTSRVERIPLGQDPHTAEGGDTLAVDFLKAPPARRISLVEDIVNEKSNERASALLDAIERQIQRHINNTSASSVHELMKAQQYISQAGASVKQLLHHLALVLPQTDVQEE